MYNWNDFDNNFDNFDGFDDYPMFEEDMAGTLPGYGFMPQYPWMTNPCMPYPCMPYPCMPEPCRPHPCKPLPPKPCKCPSYVKPIEDYYYDEYPECEFFEDYLDILNEQYPDLCNDEIRCLLRELMEIDFAITELVLYLDTHPTDKKALERYNYYICIRKPILKKLQDLYGPITNRTKVKCPWAWLNQPWPWRIEY